MKEMEFKYSTIGDNTQENREWLEMLGYKLSGANVGDTLCVCVDGFYQCKNYNLGKTRFQVFLDMLKAINCLGNPQLFQAVSAIREDSDYMQWFVTDFSNKLIPTEPMYLSENKYFNGVIIPHNNNIYIHEDGFHIGSTGFHKATLIELQEKFKL